MHAILRIISIVPQVNNRKLGRIANLRFHLLAAASSFQMNSTVARQKKYCLSDIGIHIHKTFNNVLDKLQKEVTDNRNCRRWKSLHILRRLQAHARALTTREVFRPRWYISYLTRNFGILEYAMLFGYYTVLHVCSQYFVDCESPES